MNQDNPTKLTVPQRFRPELPLSTPAPLPTLDPRYLEGIACFNRQEYFEAHDIWEELWADIVGDGRQFYQGLIQVAVCLHHFGNGNLRGARRLFVSSTNYLQPYAPCYQYLPVDRLLQDFSACCAQMMAPPTETKVTLDPQKLPQIQLEMAADH